MFALTAATRIYLYHGIYDMRESFDGLCGIVRSDLGADTLSGLLPWRKPCGGPPWKITPCSPMTPPPGADMQPEERCRFRQEYAAPLLAGLFEKIEELRRQTILSEPLQNAIDYTLNQHPVVLPGRRAAPVR